VTSTFSVPVFSFLLVKLLQSLLHHASGLALVIEESDRTEQHRRTNIARIRHFIEIARMAADAYRQRKRV
jgi:hypothetical protein